jgi:hypothetical protein
MAGRRMSLRRTILIAGILVLAAPACAQAQICTHGSNTSLYVCFPFAAPPAPGKEGVASSSKNMKAAPAPGATDTATSRSGRGK